MGLGLKFSNRRIAIRSSPGVTGLREQAGARSKSKMSHR